MKKTLSYYMRLRYKLEIRPIPEEEGGGFEARIPQLGGDAYCGYGDTIESAVKTLNEVKEDMFRNYIENNIEIPHPTEQTLIDDCSNGYIYSSDLVSNDNYGFYKYALAS